MNYGGIDEKYASFDKASFVVVPVPYDLTTTYQAGARRGPSAILDASYNMELYDEVLDRETYLSGIHTMPPLEPEAGGPHKMVNAIRNAVDHVLTHHKIPVILGGDHSVTIGAVQAMVSHCPTLSVLHLDAHADMRHTYQGTPYSHACVSRRIYEMCPVVQVGVRSMSAEEAVFMRENDIKKYSPEDVLEGGSSYEKIVTHLSEDVYITIDLDVFDPSIMPAVGTPEPGGVYWKDVVRLVREVSNSCTIRGFDVVELAPIPGLVAPEFTAAKLIYRVMGYSDPMHY